MAVPEGQRGACLPRHVLRGLGACRPCEVTQNPGKMQVSRDIDH